MEVAFFGRLPAETPANLVSNLDFVESHLRNARATPTSPKTMPGGWVGVIGGPHGFAIIPLLISFA